MPAPKITRARLIAAAIAVFWAAMMAALVKRELLPAWTSAEPVDYGSLLSSNEVSRQSRMAIYFRDARIGRVETQVHRTRDGGIELCSNTTLSLAELGPPLLAAVGKVRTGLIIQSGRDGGLRRFDFYVHEPLDVCVRGATEGGRLRLTTQFEDGQASETLVDYDPRMILANAFSPFLGLHNLRVGKQWRFASLDPLTRQMKVVTVTVTGRETLDLGGEQTDAFVLTSEYGSLQVRSWVAPDGVVLRMETPYGFSLVREAPSQ